MLWFSLEALLMSTTINVFVVKQEKYECYPTEKKLSEAIYMNTFSKVPTPKGNNFLRIL